jgi:hypothetical protein
MLIGYICCSLTSRIKKQKSNQGELIMPIQRNVDGYSALQAGHPLANLDIGNKFKWSEYFQDFTGYGLAQTTGDDHLLTQTNGTETLVGPTGVYTLTLGGADNDLAQWKPTNAGAFQLSSTKRTFFQCRFKVTAATMASNELFIGLASAQTGTAFFAADGLSLTMDDAVGFYKLDTDAAMSVTMRENDVGSTDGALTPTTGDWFTVGIYYDGSEAKFYQSAANGAADGSDMALAATLTATDTTSVVKPQIYIKAGAAEAHVLACDYIAVFQER